MVLFSNINYLQKNNYKKDYNQGAARCYVCHVLIDNIEYGAAQTTTKKYIPVCKNCYFKLINITCK